MRRLIIFTIGCLFSQSIYAQEKSKGIEHRERYIISEALLFLDQYENDDIWRGTGDEGFFYQLFGKTSTLVNDIPMANSQQMVRVDKYIDDLLILFNRQEAYIDLYPYSISVNESFSSSNSYGSGDVFIDVKKTIDFKSPNEPVATYKDTLDQRFHLKYTYNEAGIDFQIELISSNEKLGKYIIVKYGVKGLSEEQLQQEFGNVLVKSEKGIRSIPDSYGIFTLNDFSPENDFKIYSENGLYFQKKSAGKSLKSDLGGDTIRNPANISELRFRKKGWSLSPEFHYEWQNVDSQNSSFNSDVNSRVTQLSSGLLIGKRLYSKVNQSLTFQFGGGVANLSSVFQITPFTSAAAAVDDAGDSYTRITKTKNLVEAGQVSRNYLSVALNYSRRFKTTEVGLYTGGHYLLTGRYNYSTNATAKYSGLYGPEYFNILIDDPQHYDFGEYTVSLEDNTNLIEELNLVYGISVFQDLNRRAQLGVSFGYNSVLTSPFGAESTLSNVFSEFQSIQELDDQLWNDRFSTKISIIYFL